MSVDTSLQKHNHETSNWAYFWLRKSAERFAEFLLPSTAKPQSDLMDPPWLTPSQEENHPIISFMTRNQEHDHAIDILSLLGNHIDHGAWLSAWNVPPGYAQNAATDYFLRSVWQPERLDVVADITDCTLYLQQHWKNPNYVSRMQLGAWNSGDSEWIMIADVLKHHGSFRVMVSPNLQCGG